ncbi:MAG: hypothetical protein JO316_09650 [Abitibacteriaceae bacterium]|nr:hypothetical protein [Abditibacteriaceae bacterium]
MSKKALLISGWIAIVYAVVDVPRLTLYWFADNFMGTSGAQAAQGFISLSGLLLWLFLFIRLRQLLNNQFGFHQVDAEARTLIWMSVALTGLNLFEIATRPISTLLLIISITAVIVVSVVGTVFAIKLLRLPHQLYGLLRPYCYTLMVANLSYATLFLLPLGILFGIANSIILGMIFFRSAELIRPGC